MLKSSKILYLFNSHVRIGTITLPSGIVSRQPSPRAEALRQCLLCPQSPLARWWFLKQGPWEFTRTNYSECAHKHPENFKFYTEQKRRGKSKLLWSLPPFNVSTGTLTFLSALQTGISLSRSLSLNVNTALQNLIYIYNINFQNQ